MNKKGIIVAVVVIILIVLGFVVWGGDSTTSVTNNTGTETGKVEVPEGVTKDTYAPVTKDSTDTSLMGKLKSASVSASETGTRVALEGGKASFTDAGVKGTITLGDIATEATVDGAKYVLTSLAVNSGAAQTFNYVVLFEDKNGTLTDKSYAVVGDRVKITGIRGDVVAGQNGSQLVASVTFTENGSNTSKTKIYVVDGGVFKEIL